jgi:hypothetical protein
MRLTITRARSFDGVAASEALVIRALEWPVLRAATGYYRVRADTVQFYVPDRRIGLRGWVNHDLLVGDTLIVRGGDFDPGDTVYVKRSPLDHWRSLKGDNRLTGPCTSRAQSFQRKR